MGWLQKQESEPRLRFCPRCGAAMLVDHPSVEKCEISWDAENSQFIVTFSVDLCHQCGGGLQRQLKHIPVLIEQRSQCSCGANLALKSHTLRRKDNYLEFDGQYVCEKCNKSKNTFLKKVGKGLSSLWRDTRSIEISPQGILYNKESKDG